MDIVIAAATGSPNCGRCSPQFLCTGHQQRCPTCYPNPGTAGERERQTDSERITTVQACPGSLQTFIPNFRP